MSSVAFSYGDSVVHIPLAQTQMLQRRLLTGPHDSSRALGDLITEHLPDGTVLLNDGTGHIVALEIDALLEERDDEPLELRALREVIFDDRRKRGMTTRGNN